MLKTFRLKNGIRVATYNMPELRSVNLTITIKGGSLVESREQEGVAHFMEHMLVQGIPSFPNAQKLSEYAESLAGNYNAYTSQTTVSFTMTAPFSYAADTVRIASEVFFEPLFPEAAFEKERRAVLNEIDQKLDSRWNKFHEFTRNTRYVPNSVFQQQTVGNKVVIKRLKIEDLKEYWNKYFIPNNTYFFICGNLKNIDIEKLIRDNFEKLKSDAKFSGFPKISRDDLAEGQAAIRSDKELQVNYIDLVFPAATYFDDLSVKVKQEIALTILGKLRTSRLFQLLRYQKGLVYGVSANHYLGLGVGTAFISSETATEHLTEVVELIVKEFLLYREKGPLPEELKFAKNYLSNKWLMSFDHPSAIAEWVNSEIIWRDNIFLPEDYIKILNDITVEDIIKLMQDIWDMKKLQLIIQGPVENSEENINKFTKLIEPLK